MRDLFPVSFVLSTVPKTDFGYLLEIHTALPPMKLGSLDIHEDVREENLVLGSVGIVPTQGSCHRNGQDC